MNIQGYIRFSYLGKNDTRLASKHADNHDVFFNALYNPLRMARRFHMFEKLCIPGLQQQSDKDFSVIVAASNVMPQIYKDRLESAVSGLPQIQIHYSEERKVEYAVRPHVKRFVDSSARPTLHFRLDDDDALGKDAIAGLKAMGERAEPETILTQPSGYSLFRRGGKPYLLPRYDPFHSVGWTRVNASGDYRSPFKFGHFRSSRRFPSMADPRTATHVYVMHSESDTAQSNKRKMDTLLTLHQDASNHKNQAALKSAVFNDFPAIELEGFYETILTVPQVAPDTDLVAH